MEKTVLCYIKNTNDEYLMLHRTKKKNDLNQGKWLGIGGHIEKDETPLMAVKREVLEETGLVIDEYKYRAKLLFVNDSYSELIYLYTADSLYDKVINCNEGDLRWIKKNEIMNLSLWEGDREFLKKILEDDLYFEMKLIYENDKFIRGEFCDISTIY